ncbi:MAG: FAD:protein FMN transferase [Chloroflexota bacterium]
MIHKHEFKAMGCHMLAVLDMPGEDQPAQLEQVPSLFEAWEQSLSRFRETSELSQLNLSAGTPVQVSETLWDVLQESLLSERRSLGLVTPAVLDALVMAGYDRSFNQLAPTSSYLTFDRAPVGLLSEILLDESNRTVCLPPDLHLDFGGVAKGWAADQAARKLSAFGPALVNAGGDIAISGPQSNGGAWPIGITNPFDPEENLETLMIERGGVATSGKDYRRWQQDSVWQHHIIDPRTNLPAQTDVLTATVVAPSAVAAEVAAKVALISGSGAGLAWLESNSLAGMLVLEDGERLYSQRISEYLWS